MCQQQDTLVLDKTNIYLWDSMSNDWVYDQYIDYEYDKDLNQTESICNYRSNPEINKWQAYWRYVYAYDAEGNRTDAFYYYWD